MADLLKLKSGTRLQLAFDVPPDKDPDFNLISTFYKELDTSAFLISAPMKDGRPMKMDEDQKLLIRYSTATEPMIIAGYPDDEIKEGIRRYWKIRRVAEQRKFFQRADERLKVSLRVTYTQNDWKPDFDGNIEPEDGMTLDISAGGVALYLNRHFEVGESCNLNLPRIGVGPGCAPLQNVVCVVCWCRDAPRGSLYRRVAGLQFRFSEGEARVMGDYVANVKKRYKL